MFNVNRFELLLLQFIVEGLILIIIWDKIGFVNFAHNSILYSQYIIIVS